MSRVSRSSLSLSAVIRAGVHSEQCCRRGYSGAPPPLRKVSAARGSLACLLAWGLVPCGMQHWAVTLWATTAYSPVQSKPDHNSSPISTNRLSHRAGIIWPDQWAHSSKTNKRQPLQALGRFTNAQHWRWCENFTTSQFSQLGWNFSPWHVPEMFKCHDKGMFTIENKYLLWIRGIAIHALKNEHPYSLNYMIFNITITFGLV